MRPSLPWYAGCYRQGVSTSGSGKRGKQVIASQVIAQGATFGRNVVFARLLSPEDLGTAALVLTVLTLLEMSSDFVAEEVLITESEGLDKLQATIHGLRLIRSTVLLAIGAAVAWGLTLTVESFAGVMTLPVVIACVGLVLIRGLSNADVERQLRDGRYGTYAIVQATPQVIALATALPLAKWLGGPQAILGGALTQSVAYVALSHLCAARPYQVGMDVPSARRVCAFGLPVLLNGLLLFGLMHGDRLVVGTAIGTAELGQYAVATGLALVPTLVLARVNAALLLPTLSRAAESGVSVFRSSVRRAMTTNGLVAAAMAFGWTCVGADVIRLVYGARYEGAGVLIAWLGLLQATFVLRDLHGVLAMSRGDAGHPVLGNATRIIGLILVIPVAVATSSLVAAVGVSIAAELAAYVLSTRRLTRAHEVLAGSLYWPLVWVLGAAGVGATLRAGSGVLGVSAWLPAGAVLVGVVVWLMWRSPRAESRRVTGGVEAPETAEAVAVPA